VNVEKGAVFGALCFTCRTASTSVGSRADQLPKNTLQYDAGPLQVDGASACATPEAAANMATEAIRVERMRFMMEVLVTGGSRSEAIDGAKNSEPVIAQK
jgi:hypothetical protein